MLIIMAELDHQRSAAKTLVNKMRLHTFVLFKQPVPVLPPCGSTD